VARAKTARIAHPSRTERAARGKAARGAVSRSSLGEYEPAAKRADPVELLERQAATRVPELVPIRYGRMLSSPFAFYRGAALVMAADLAPSPVSGITVQACGDAHMMNFGVYASPERRLVFDVNDFDETLPGPWEWDVKRLAASLTIGARDAGFSTRQQRGATAEACREYRTAMAEFAGMTNLAVWYAHIDIDAAIKELTPMMSRGMEKRADRTLAKARSHDSLSALSKLTHNVEGEPRFVSEPPLLVPIAELGLLAEGGEEFETLRQLLDEYRASLQADRRVLLEQFRLVDLARKVVGVGSVGTRCWVALLLGVDNEDPLFLQIKEADSAVLEEFLEPSEYANHGERVVAGQHLMQAVSDIFLGWLRVPAREGEPSRDLYGRQLRDWKGSLDSSTMAPGGLALYGRLCARTLARAHARSGDRVAIAAYLGKGDAFERAMVAFAEAYAEQNERDYAELKKAAADGRVTAEAGI